MRVTITSVDEACARSPSQASFVGFAALVARSGAGGKPLITEPTNRSWIERGSL